MIPHPFLLSGPHGASLDRRHRLTVAETIGASDDHPVARAKTGDDGDAVLARPSGSDRLPAGNPAAGTAGL